MEDGVEAIWLGSAVIDGSGVRHDVPFFEYFPDFDELKSAGKIVRDHRDFMGVTVEYWRRVDG